MGNKGMLVLTELRNGYSLFSFYSPYSRLSIRVYLRSFAADERG